MWPFNSLKSLRANRTETGARFYVRSAAQADVEALIPLKLDIWAEIYGSLVPAEQLEAARASQDEQIEFWLSRTKRTAKEDPRLFIAEDLKGRPVGMATVELPSERVQQLYEEATGEHLNIPTARQMHEAGDTVAAAPWVEVRNIYLIDSVRGEPGLAQALLDTALGTVKEDLKDAGEQHQIKNVLTLVPTALQRATRFFRAQGFEPLGPPSAQPTGAGPWVGLEEQLMVRRDGV